MNNKLELSIVMPCLNEAETLGICIAKAQKFLDRTATKGEIVVADNGSTDGSVGIAHKFGARVVNVQRKGYGSALQGGIDAAEGKFVIMGDADDSYDFDHLENFLEKLRSGDDLVMGNRFLGGIQPGAMPWHHRYIGNPILSGFGRLLFNSKSGDFHCGLRGFSKSAYDRMQMRTTGMEFASEMVIKATLLDLSISEVPVTLYPDGRSRPPHLRSVRDGWRHLRFMLIYSPAWLFLYPGVFLIFLGLALMIWLLPGPQPFGGIVLDIHTLLYAAAMVILGFQSIIFALFTREFAETEGLIPHFDGKGQKKQDYHLEYGLLIGLVMMVIGAGGTVGAVITWGEKGFGVLNPSQIMRITVPSILAFTLGMLSVFASFFLGILRLTRK